MSEGLDGLFADDAIQKVGHPVVNAVTGELGRKGEIKPAFVALGLFLALTGVVGLARLRRRSNP